MILMATSLRIHTISRPLDTLYTVQSAQQKRARAIKISHQYYNGIAAWRARRTWGTILFWHHIYYIVRYMYNRCTDTYVYFTAIYVALSNAWKFNVKFLLMIEIFDVTRKYLLLAYYGMINVIHHVKFQLNILNNHSLHVNADDHEDKMDYVA